MLIKQYEFSLRAQRRGFHLITDEVLQHIDIERVSAGMLNLFIKHTSASLTINENADPSVRTDMEHFANDICDDKSYFIHTCEGADDMPAHLKSSLFGNSLSIPITAGKLNMGIWQGIYLGEHRDYGGARDLIATIIGQ